MTASVILVVMADSQTALLARFEAHPEHADEVAAFLHDSLADAREEPGMTTWFALRFDETGFGIFDTFPDEEGRQAHLEGVIAAALMDNAEEWFVSGPDIEEVEVLEAMHAAE
jgi:quinol monooxygenase YgiN